MTRWLDDREQRVWRSFLSASSRLDSHLARRMQADAGLSPTRYQADSFPPELRSKLTVIHDGIEPEKALAAMGA